MGVVSRFFWLLISSFFNILIDAQVDSFNNWLCFEINKANMKLDNHKLLEKHKKKTRGKVWLKSITINR